MAILHNVPSYVKVEPYGNTQDKAIVAGASTVTVRAVAGDALDFYFPRGYIDLTSLAMMFRYYVLPYTTAVTANTQALPKDCECLIQKLEVFLGDKKVNDINNYTQIFFILSMFAFDAEFRTNRDTYTNVWNNGRTTVTGNTVEGTQFCLEKWLGLLGKPIVLDTNKLGQLHIKITLAGAYITSSNNAAHSWGIGDVFMRVKYYTNYNKELPRYIEFDDYKSIITRSPSYNQTTELIVNSSRIDYVIGRVLRSDAFGKSIGLVADVGSTAHFGSFAGNVSSWNFTVNNTPLHRYTPTTADGLMSMYDIFKPHRSVNSGVAITNTARAYQALWTCGAEVAFQSEIPEQVEIKFITDGNTASACLPLLIAKTTASLEIKDDGTIVQKV